MRSIRNPLTFTNLVLDPEFGSPAPLQNHEPVFQMKPNFQELYVDGSRTEYGKGLYVAPAELPGLPTPPRPPMPSTALYRDQYYIN